jgi:hypothetical protein
MGRSVMNIQPISTYNISMQSKTPPKNSKGVNKIIDKYTQKILDIFSTKTLKDDFQTIRKMQERDAQMSNPAINRGIMGATAIILQPPIDANNKAVDKETRRMSVCRTVAKIIVGTLVGIMVRGSSHKLISKMTDIEAKGKYSRKLIPKKYFETFKNNPTLLKNYRSALSTGLAILAMCITNFAIDAPLTVYLTNKFKNATEPKKVDKKTEVAYG